MITLCDEGSRLYTDYKRLESLENEKMKIATRPFELSMEFYQAANNYINHINSCDDCKLT